MIIWRTNHPLSKDIIDPIVLSLKNNDKACKYYKDFKFYSSFIVPLDERPDYQLASFYLNFLEKEAGSDLGLTGRVDVSVPFWMQIYVKGGGTHRSHDHFTGKEIISWVHFLRPSSKKCFYFLNSKGEKTYPIQNEGDFIMFPSWAIHGVDPHTDDEDRVVVAGNIIINHIITPEIKACAYTIGNGITVWTTEKMSNLTKEVTNDSKTY